MSKLSDVMVELGKSGKYFITDRQNTFAFMDVWRDSLFQYSFDSVLVERFFKKSRCHKEETEVEALPDEVADKIRQQEAILDSMKQHIEKKERIPDEERTAIEKLQEEIKAAKPVRKKIQIDVYNVPMTTKKYVMVEPDFIVDNMNIVEPTYEAFLRAYGAFTSYQIPTSDFVVTTIENPDYIDVVVRIK